MLKLKNFFKSNLSIIILFLLIDLVFFRKFFLQDLIPIPADLIIGGYYPWLNEKWGYIVGVPVKNPMMSDIVSLIYPWRKLAIDLIKSGQLPLWDSTSFLGTTLIGNFQAGILNPFNLLFLIPIGFNKIWALQVAIQPIIALSSMYLFLRSWKLSKPSAIFGAISFAFSAQLLVWYEYNLLGFNAAVFPLYIYLIDKYLTSSKIYVLSLISLIFAYLVFVGYPQYVYYFGFFGFIYFLFFQFMQKNSKTIILRSLLFALFALIGLCLSGIILLPGLEALRLSVKNLDEAAAGNSVLFFPWQNLLTAFIPDYFGNPATNNYYGIGHYESLIFYTSIISLPFAAIAAAKYKKPQVIILLIFLATSFILALKTPVSELIQNFNLLGLKGSVSSRVLFIYGFSISSLAAFGMEKFINEKKLEEKIYQKYLPLFVVIGILVGVFVSITIIKLILGSNFPLIKDDYMKLLISVKNSILPLALALSASALIILSKYINKKILILCFIVLIILDYARFSDKYLPFLSSSKIFPETSSIEFLKNQNSPYRIAIERGELLPANTWSSYGIESISGYNILLPKDTADYISFSNSEHISEGYVRFVDINNFDSKFLDLANTKYLLVLLRKDGIADEDGTPPYNLDLQKYEQVYKEGAVAIYKNKTYLERFSTPINIQTAQTNPDAYKKILSSDFNIKDSVVLDTNFEEKLISCQLSNLNYQSQRISLSADCPGDGFLFFSQVYYPGWNAKINNQTTPILKANGIFSGLKLPPGKSQIIINYFPDSFKYGIYLTLVSGLILILVNIFALIKFKR